MAVIEAIQTTYVEANVASVVFASIPQTYQHLQIRGSAHSEDGLAHPHSNWGNYLIRYNGEAGSYYSRHNLYAGDPRNTGGQVAAIEQYSGDTKVSIEGAPTFFNNDTNYGSIIIDVPDYTSTNKFTSILTLSGKAGAEPVVCIATGLWFDSTGTPDAGLAAITQIDIIVNEGWTRGTVFSLYGLKVAN